MTPEAKAREKIGQKLSAADWLVQDLKQLNLGAAIGVAVREYPTDGRTFTELYNVQRLSSSAIDPHAQVVISTIQRMYSVLSGEPIDDSAEDVSLNEVHPWRLRLRRTGCPRRLTKSVRCVWQPARCADGRNERGTGGLNYLLLSVFG